MQNNNLEKLIIESENELNQADSFEKLKAFEKKYLNKKGEITLVFTSFKSLSSVERAALGKKANDLKVLLGKKLREKLLIFEEISSIKDKEDISLPGHRPEIGRLHPLTQGLRVTTSIFENMGFSIIDGPELENEWYNFDALNFPSDHPAREMQDTLFIKQKNRDKLSSKEKFLMRTHTSPVQVRYMEKHKPPLRVIVPGRVFRNEATDASHEVNFYQIEGLMIDKNISVANFKSVIEQFFRAFFEKEVKIRLRPSYFPFTEPSFEVDMSCLICNGRGCSVCSQTGWVEMMGAGMVHKNVLKNSGIDPKKWQGFAFGMGDRIVMMKYKIDDARLFYSGDLRFLEQF